MPKTRYAEAGVDLKRVKHIHRSLAEKLSETFSHREKRLGQVLSGIGHYAGMVDIGYGRALALHVDGVGTKVIIAQMMDRYDTIGIDCVAMCVNDLICVGSQPLSLVDYIALEKSDNRLVDEIITGLVKGASTASITIVGGETAIMPDVIKSYNGRGFDLAATGMGVVDKKNIITGSNLKTGDIILGIESSGIHSNGFTLARKTLLRKHRVDEYIAELDRTLGEELLEPTLIYVKPVLEVIKKCEVHGLAHITGGGFSKLKRIGTPAGLGFLFDQMPPPSPVFKMIQKIGRVSRREMYGTFNMGIGFCICLPEEYVDDASRIFRRHNFRADTVGRVIKDMHITVDKVILD